METMALFLLSYKTNKLVEVSDSLLLEAASYVFGMFTDYAS